ncbi:hypothetical protein ACFX12_014108 [Malus domestica]
MVCFGDEESVRVLYQSLCDFQLLSGVRASASKSQIFIAGMNDISKHQILQLFSIPLGSLLVCYLGVPLITSKLRLCDCSPLIDKTKARIKH